MKKSTLTENKAEQTPTGGVLVGKRQGQTIIHNKGTLSGYLVGKTHAEGGIKAVNKSTGQALEMQGGEVVITAPAVSDNTKNEFNGKMMTNREVLSAINEKGGGVSFAKGGDIPKNIKRTGASYKYGGKTMTDHEIYKHITGGHLAEGMTLTQIAKKHKVSVKELQTQVDLGMKAESEHTSSKREQMKIVKDHLYENPKYYTLLKRAGLKHGGVVRKVSLVRDSKKGNTPARDLNNYNDVIDMDADGVVGAETGLFADGGSIVFSYAKGGATDVTVNNWSEIPDSFKNIRLPKKVEWDASPSDDGLNEILKPFLGTEPLRPAMTGINFDENGITATNAHILLTIPSDERDFKGVYKKEKLSSKSLKEVFPDGFIKLDVKYPNYAQVIPKEIEVKRVVYIDILKLLTYFKVASNYSYNKEVVFKINDEKMAVFPDLMINFLSSLVKLGGSTFMNVSFQTNKRALIFTYYPSFTLGKDVIGLMMPFVYGELGMYGTENKDKNTKLNVYFDFDDNEIRNADGSLVDLEIKTTKERAKRTPKATPSKTKEQTGKTLIKEELEQSKIWIGADLALRDMVMQKLTEIGIPIDKNYGDRELLSIEDIFIEIFTDDFVVYNNGKSEFYASKRKEIFASDLGISSKTEKTISKFTSGEIDMFKQIDSVIENNNLTLVNINDWSKGDKTLDFDIVNTDTGDVVTLRSYKYSLGIPKEDLMISDNSKLLIFGYLDWKKTQSTSTPIIDEESITDEDVEIKKLILEFIKKGGWILEKEIRILDIKGSYFKEFYKLEPPTVYRLTVIDGQGLYPADPNTLKFLQKIGMYDDYEEVSKEKVSVWKLYPVSEDGQFTSDFGIYSAVQLLVHLKDYYSLFPKRDYFEFKIVDQNGKTYGNVTFLRNLLNYTDLVGFIYSRKEFTDKYNWDEFNLYDAPKEIIEEPKPSKTEKPKRNFELERKYLSQRISDLAKELDLKKPILSNEEVAFYQREINSFILKLRKLNDAEMSLKSIEERVIGVYGLKISSFDKQYEETDMTSINALKSQLTEIEYFNVRTPEFKSFFGDWETAYLNDSYAGVSKVINPITKEPQPVFHGTNVLFVNWKTYETNNAHYFAVKREMSEFFATSWEDRADKAGVDSEILKKLNPNRGNFLLRCFIDIKNPIDFSRFGVEKYPIREYLTFLRVNYNIGDFDFWTNITSHSGFTQDTEVYAWQIIRLWQSFTKYVKVFTTYDGYIFYEYIPTKPYGGLENASLSYCAFDSNQIKFADAYEFNALSNDSRFDLGGIL
jgi:hypothetical protein